MTRKMKKLYIIILAALLFGATSCVGDLNVKPIDPNTVLPEEILDSQAAYAAILAKCYQSYACSGSDGPDAGPDIEGVDGGYGQYMRAVFNMNELTTDIATVAWNDGTLMDLHNMTWSSSDLFILSMYYRIFYTVSLCNEFIRRSNAEDAEWYTNKAQYIAEARALRLFSYYHAIDMFGNVPFCTENDSVGSAGPIQIKRADLFDWMVEEATALLADSNLAGFGQNVYGRCDKGLVQMVLAKLYLNAEVWKGTAMYDKAAEASQVLIDNYALHINTDDVSKSWDELFMADNHLWTANTTYGSDNEIIFAVLQDGTDIRSYGVTNYLLKGSTGGDMNCEELGIDSGWSGLSLTGAFTSKFEESDSRANFFKGGATATYDQYIDEIRRESDGWSNGWKSMKFSNIAHDGTPGPVPGFVECDLPVFRVADAYLMYAECAARGAADKTTGQYYFDIIRRRAGVDEIALTLENIIDERARELYYEGMRRQDLIRFNLYTSADYLWEFKGGVQEGQGVADYRNLFPITAGDVNANPNIVQNPGY